MSRIIFVGLHNKPNINPLCKFTKSGKLITRIVKKIQEGHDVIRTNLFNIERMPEKDELFSLQDEWYWTNLPTEDDIIVLLGSFNHKVFKFNNLNVIKVAHPASKWSHLDMNKYVYECVDSITKLL